MDPKQILKDQAKQAIDREDYIAAMALLQALSAVSQTVVVNPSPVPAPTPTVGGKPLVYTGPPPVDPVIPPDEQPQATDFDLQRFAQMDEKDVRLHRR